MKKLISLLLVTFLVAGSVGLNVFAADDDMLVKLSTNKDDYIIHHSAERVSSEDGALIVEKGGDYLSHLELKDVSKKDVAVSFKLQLDEITANHNDMLFEVSVRNQYPEKELWRKFDSFSIQFAMQQYGDKYYVKTFFKKNENEKDDGGFAFCDYLMEIVDGKTKETDFIISFTSEGGNTTFKLIVDGTEKVRSTKTGYDFPAGKICFDVSSACKAIIKEADPLEETSGTVNLSTDLSDWDLIKEEGRAEQSGDSLVVKQGESLAHYQLKNFRAKDIELKFKLKLEEISGAHGSFIFEIAVRNQEPLRELYNKRGYFSLALTVNQVGTKKYIKSFFKSADGGTDTPFGYCDELVEIVDGKTPEMNISFSTITNNGNTTFKLVVNGVTISEVVREGVDLPAGAVVFDTEKCKAIISAFEQIEAPEDPEDPEDPKDPADPEDPEDPEDPNKSPKTSDSKTLLVTCMALFVVSLISLIFTRTRVKSTK